MEVMNVTYEKLISATAKASGINGIYKVDSNLTLNDEKKVMNADGQVVRICDNVHAASFNFYGECNKNVNFMGGAEEIGVITAINDFIKQAEMNASSAEKLFI